MKLNDTHRLVLAQVNAHLELHPLSSLSVGRRRHRHSLTARLVRSRGRTLVITQMANLAQVARQYLACGLEIRTPEDPADPSPALPGQTLAKQPTAVVNAEASHVIAADGSVTVWPVEGLGDKRVMRRYRLIVIDLPASKLAEALAWARKWTESAGRGGRIVVWHGEVSPEDPQALRWKPSRSGPMLQVNWDATRWTERIERIGNELPGKLKLPEPRRKVPTKDTDQAAASSAARQGMMPIRERSWRTEPSLSRQSSAGKGPAIHDRTSRPEAAAQPSRPAQPQASAQAAEPIWKRAVHDPSINPATGRSGQAARATRRTGGMDKR